MYCILFPKIMIKIYLPSENRLKDFNLLLCEHFKVVLKIICHVLIISEVEEEITLVDTGLPCCNFDH